MPIRWDPLLARHLALELDRRLAGLRARALRLDGETRRMTLLLREGTLWWDLHPARGGMGLLPPTEPGPADLPLPGRIRGVRAPDDERLLLVEILPERGRPPRDLVVELLGNQWNAMVVERPVGTVRHVLVRRGPPRPIQVGGAYAPPEPSLREGADGALSLARWLEILEPVPPPQRRRALLAGVAWTSSLNADALLEGEGDPAEALKRGHALWRAWVHGEFTAAPCVLGLDGSGQPYPWPLPGKPSTPHPSLLDAMDAAAGAASPAGDPRPPSQVSPEILAALETVVEGAARRAARLHRALAEIPDPGTLRSRGDLILARLGHLRPGARHVTLEGFEGEPVQLELDPTLPPHGNADALYDAAGRAARAQERLPGILQEAEGRFTALQALLHSARDGQASAEEVRAALPPERRDADVDPAAPLPYRSFRSSGGLEIRVGRGAQANDDLTFRHAAPGDVWLHARHAQGAHVILRWSRPGAPPSRDLEEAAVLAALHSRARSSGVVPVDWALRKHVRKPRGAPAGAVTPTQAKTLLVRPDTSLLDKLAAE